MPDRQRRRPDAPNPKMHQAADGAEARLGRQPGTLGATLGDSPPSGRPVERATITSFRVQRLPALWCTAPRRAPPGAGAPVCSGSTVTAKLPRSFCTPCTTAPRRKAAASCAPASRSRRCSSPRTGSAKRRRSSAEAAARARASPPKVARAARCSTRNAERASDMTAPPPSPPAPQRQQRRPQGTTKRAPRGSDRRGARLLLWCWQLARAGRWKPRGID